MERMEKPEENNAEKNDKGKEKKRNSLVKRFGKWFMAASAVAMLSTTNCSLLVEEKPDWQTVDGGQTDADTDSDGDTDMDGGPDLDADTDTDGDTDMDGGPDLDADTDGDTDVLDGGEPDADVEDGGIDGGTDEDGGVETCDTVVAPAVVIGWINLDTPMDVERYRLHYGSLAESIDGIVVHIHCSEGDVEIEANVEFEDLVGGDSFTIVQHNKVLTIEINQKNDFAAHITATVTDL